MFFFFKECHPRCVGELDRWEGREKPWWWPYKAETCCFTSNLRIYIFYKRYELCFWLPFHLSSSVYVSVYIVYILPEYMLEHGN